ncbi:exonuclease domain-containing protein [Patescibacteria group bacterium]
MFVALDLETTGVNPEKDKIIEFGATKFDLDGPKENLQFLINPVIEIPAISTHITGITDQDVKDAPTFDQKQKKIQNFIQDLPIVGHNISFDTNFLKANGIEIPNPEYDTLQLASILLPQSPSQSLETLSQILKIKHDQKHRALDDALASMELFIKLCQEFQALPSEIIERIHKILKKTDWPLSEILLNLKRDDSIKKTTFENTKTDESSEFEKEVSQKIVKTDKNTLFEITSPYKFLAKEIILKEDPDTYVSVSNKLFNLLTHELPHNIAKLDCSKNFLSLNRLKNLENQDNFEENQATALIKFIIWSKETKTGLLNEINLFPKERDIIPYINADETQTILDDETFYQKAIAKDESSPAICTNQYLKELKEIKKLIIIDFENFENYIHFQTTTFLNIDLFIKPLKNLLDKNPQNQSIQSLISKAEILFGLIGIIFEKYNDQNPYKARLIVSNLEIASSEWTNIKESINNIFDISKELIEISSPENQFLLQNWKDQLKNLLEIFNKPDIYEHTVIFEQDYYGNIAVRKIPKNIQKEISELLENCESYQIIGETFDLLDNGEFLKKLFNLDSDLPIEKFEKKSSKKEITIIKDMPENEQASRQPFLEFIDNITDKYSGRTAILFNSLKQLEFNTFAIKKIVKDKNISIVSKLTGSIGKISTQFLANPDNSILLLTPRIWQILSEKGVSDHIDNLIIQKIPFEAPSDPFLTALSENYENPFFELQIPRAAIALKKAINRLDGQGTKKIFILDSRLVNKQYAKYIRENLSTISKIQIVNAHET